MGGSNARGAGLSPCVVPAAVGMAMSRIDGFMIRKNEYSKDVEYDSKVVEIINCSLSLNIS